MSLPTSIEEGDPSLTLSSVAATFQVSTGNPSDNHSNPVSRSTTFEDINSSLPQSPVGVRSPSQLESNTGYLRDVTDAPDGIRLIRFQQTALKLVVLQVTVLVMIFVTVMLNIYLPK
jgi:hypothetical protein